MTVCTRFNGAAATAVISGELDIRTKHALRRALTDVLDRRPEWLVLDLTDVTFIDCAAARVLAAAGRDLSGDRKVIVRPSRIVRRVLELTGMSAGFWIDHSPPGREGWFRSIASARAAVREAGHPV